MRIFLRHSQHYLVFLILLLSAVVSDSADAQVVSSIPRLQSSTLAGRDFYVGFMRNEIDENRNLDRSGYDRYMLLEVYIGATEKTQVIFRYPWQTDSTIYSIEKDSVLTISVPVEYLLSMEMKQSEVPTKGLIEIHTDKKTIVYAMNHTGASSDAYAALPVTNWGKEYVIMSTPNDSYLPYQYPEDTIPRSSEFMIMASEDSTLVQFRPKAKTVMGFDTNDLVSIYLMKGQCYLVMTTQKLLRGYGDLTGTIVRSDKPIGVLSGHVRTAIPVVPNEPIRPDGRGDSKDHLVEMLMPTKIWGMNYISTPFSINSTGDYIRVVSIQPNTKVTAYGNNTFRDFVLTNPGDIEDFYPVGVPVVWIADKPIQIAQIMPSSAYDREFSQKFDPCMVILPPLEQFVSRILCEVPRTPAGQYGEPFSNFVNIVCERSAITTLTLDGTLLMSLYPRLYDQQIPGTQYNWLVIPIKPGVHSFKADTGKFSGIMYGTLVDDSYALSLGLSLLKTSFVDSVPPTLTFTENCDKIDVTAEEVGGTSTIGLDELTVLTDSTVNYKWTVESSTEITTKLNLKAEPIDITKNGQIIIEARDKLGNGKRLKYLHNALSIEVRSDIVFKAVNWKDSTCELVTVKNIGRDTIEFLGSSIAGDSRVQFENGIPLVNKRIAPKDSVKFTVCFKPNFDSTALNAVLSLNVDCDRTISIPITGAVAAPSLLVKGWDFGKVLIGDTACATVYVINNGNSVLDIQKLAVSPYEPAYSYDTLGLFPKILLPGDSLPIRVCFIPLARRVYTQTGTVSNSQNLPNGVQIVTGEGVAPMVENVTIDWKKRRLATINDTSVLLVNRGNYPAVVKYISTTGDSARTSSMAQLMLPATLEPGDTLMILARFIPDEIRAFQSQIIASVMNWKLHNQVEITLLGEGTLPTVATENVDFDTIRIRTFKDTTALVLRAGGNETLTIDRMIWFSGDSTAFEVAPRDFDGRRMFVGENYLLPIRFVGNTLGEHKATIAVIHDALPAYRRDTSLIHLRGYVLNDDTVRASLELPAPPMVMYACSPDTITYIVKNTGNRPLQFQQITHTVTNLTIVPLVVPPVQILLPDSTLIAYYRIEMSKGLVGTITSTVQYDDTIYTTVQHTITSRENPTTIATISDTIITPGGMLDLHCTGTFSADAAMPILPIITLGLDYQIVDLQASVGLLELRDSFGSYSIPVRLRQERSRVFVQTDSSIMLPKGITHWRLSVPFAVMLSQYDECTIDVTLKDSLENCFSESKLSRVLPISEVCANAFRKVAEVGIQFNLIGVTPSPVRDIGTAEITLQGDGVIRVDAVSQLGERIPIAVENLKSGRYELQFSTKNFASGVYGIIVRAADGRERRGTFVIER